MKPSEKPSVSGMDEDARDQKVATNPLGRAARELPVARYRPEIVDTIRSYGVTIIEGTPL